MRLIYGYHLYLARQEIFKSNSYQNKQTLKYRAQMGGCQRGGGWRMGKIGEGNNKEVQTFSYQISKSQTWKVHPRECSQYYCNNIMW